MRGGSYHIHVLEEADFKEIDQVLNKELSDENKFALEKARIAYVSDRTTPPPQRGTTKKQLQSIKNICEDLLNELVMFKRWGKK